MSRKFRLPNEINLELPKRVPVTARIKEPTKLKLEAATKKKKGLSLATLIEAILEDYVQYLENKGEL
jgi:hypothetical protein